MVEIKPTFYDSFHCVAGECPMTCCMQWKIAVDEGTLAKWKQLKTREILPEVPENQYLSDNVVMKDGGNVIGLNEQGYCPFLNGEKLCGLVIKHGDSVLSRTCDTFPRQVHEFQKRREMSLVSCCPALVDYFRNETFSLNDTLNEKEQDGCYRVRKLLMESVLSDTNSLDMTLKKMFYILLDIYDRTAEKDLDELSLMDYQKGMFQKELENTIADIPIDATDSFLENVELWLDMVENYRKEGIYLDNIEKISQYAESLLEKQDNAKEMDSILEAYEAFQKQMEVYNSLLRNFLASEFFTNLVLPDSDAESMTVMFQWIVMEYVMIRIALFLKCQMQGSINYEDVRELIVVVARMTGYDEEDIFEYMENSFEELIWEWGYIALLLGE